ncbi:uncharacterized protein BDV14DRAFT_203619 [Aspergillus stella-maris]|uniref:uncharacterized protein n=1 Tax=Aspergillus stella-maris TaxID=1810926 RepID=UPI003CCD2DC5
MTKGQSSNNEEQRESREVSHRNSPEDALSGSLERSLYSVVYAKELEGGSEKETIQQAKAALESARYDDEIDVQDAHHGYIAANPEGRKYIETMDEVRIARSNLAGLKELVSKLQPRNEVLEQENSELKRMVETLRSGCDDIKKIRERFICVHRRDHMGDKTPGNWKIITTGNDVAHGGYCFLDADFYHQYVPGSRRDIHVYKRLYGLSPLEVIRLEDSETIGALNKHAKWVANDAREVSDAYKEAFDKFIHRLKQDMPAKGGMGKDGSRIRVAYEKYQDLRVKAVDDYERKQKAKPKVQNASYQK